MKITFFILLAFFGLMQSQTCDKKTMRNTDINAAATPKTTPATATKFDRLPANITLETEVRKDKKDDKGQIVSYEIMTVEKRLNELKARYEKDKLVDGKGKEIRFFEPLCRGASAGFEQDQADQKAKDKELSEMEKKYTVIILHCDPRNVL